MNALSAHTTELLNAGWLVPQALEKALGDYVATLQQEQTERGVQKLLWDDDWEDDELPTAPMAEGESVWVIDMESVMWKSSYSRRFGAAFVADTLDQAYADPQCKGVLLRVGNGMGGERKASYMVADAVMRRTKPVGGYIEYGSAYSGHYLAVCGCDFIVCSNETDSVGSIGAYISYIDWDAADAKWGIVRKDIYAEASPDKNKPIREAKKGNFKLLEAEAQEIALQFQERVVLCRGEKLTSDVPLRGGDFDAPKALTLGLIDGIGTMQSAIQKTLKLSSNFSNKNPNTSMFGFMKAPKLQALKGVAAADITEDQLNDALTELTEAGCDGLVELLQGLQQETATPPAKVDVKASTEYKALEGQLTAANKTIANLQTQLSGYENPGAEATKVVKKTEKIEATGGDEEDPFESEADVQMAKLWKMQRATN